MEVEMTFLQGVMACFTDSAKLSAERDSRLKFMFRTGTLKMGRFFQTKVYAIVSVGRTEVVMECREARVFISSVIQAAIKALCAAKITSPLALKYVEARENLAKAKEVPRMLVPSQWRIEGNNVADELGCVGTNRSAKD